MPVNEDEINYVAGEAARTIGIDRFIDKNNIDFINIEKTYYLVPDKGGDKPYVILREALNSSNKIGIAKVLISTKEHLAAVACYQNSLVLYLLKYHDEIKPLTDFKIPTKDVKKYKVTTKEIQVAKQLIKTLSTSWQPEKYKDEFSLVVHKWAEKKAKKIAIARPKKTTKNVSSKTNIDFVKLLTQSLKKKDADNKIIPALSQSKKKKHGSKSISYH